MVEYSMNQQDERTRLHKQKRHVGIWIASPIVQSKASSYAGASTDCKEYTDLVRSSKSNHRALLLA